MITLDIPSLVDKYNRPVPRYTSFPTAVQFHDKYGKNSLEESLKNLSCEDPVSLYVHIPFCHSLCLYCGCHTKIVHEIAPISAYITTLCEEIRLVAHHIGKKLKVSRLHFGGGTPNYPPVEDIKRILTTLGDSFQMDENLEIDMECDPRLLNPDKIKTYAELGIRRISLGIQDFDEVVQKAVNRIQPYSLIEKQVSNLRENGFHAINFDLIIGLPEQTEASVQKTLDLVTTLKPDRIAVFAYAHVPWMKKHQKLLEVYTLPDANLRFVMNGIVKRHLISSGYQPIGIDHYALPEDSLAIAQRNGTMKRNFQGYTDDRASTILGLGLSAISQFKDAYAQNAINVSQYRKMIEDGHLAVERGITLSSQDINAREIIMKLMCNFEVHFGAYGDVKIDRHQLAHLAQDGLIDMEEGRIRMTDLGKPFTRVVASCFDPYLNQEENRHAKAV